MKRLLLLLSIFIFISIKAQVTLSHNISDDIILTNMFSCYEGEYWGRTFTLQDFGISSTHEFNITSGKVGIGKSHGGAEARFKIYKIDDNFPNSFSESDLIGSSQIVHIPNNSFGSPIILNINFNTPILIRGDVEKIFVVVKKTIAFGITVPTAFIAGTVSDNDFSWYKGCVGNHDYATTIDMAPPKPNANFYITVNGNPILITIPNCTQIAFPANNSINNSPFTSLGWAAVSNAYGYYISIGTSPGTFDIANNLDLGLTITYVPPINWSENTTYYITVNAYNNAGVSTSCVESNFTTGLITIPNCTLLNSPTDLETNVSINSNLSWNSITEATGYKISIGTNTGLTDIENNFDLGNTTNYTPIIDWLENTTYYVTIIAYNSAGNAINCNETSFTTETIITIPNCTLLNSPTDLETNVSINSNLSWNSITEATGYKISIGTNTGLTNIENNLDLGNTTNYTPITNWSENTTYYVTIIAYNSAGDAINCNETSFTTETIITIPNCTLLNSPIDLETNVSINSNLSWNSITEATGYKISIGTNTGLTDIENNFDLGNTTSYIPIIDWLENTTYYVTVIAYNSAGDAINCTETSFSTETIITIPNCTLLNNPTNLETNVSINSNLSWNSITDATGYKISIGTSTGLTNIENDLDLGNITNYTPITDWSENTTYYVTIIAYNNIGDAINCVETSFSTETIIILPNCTLLNNPINDSVYISLDSNLTWTAVDDVEGYTISIGTLPNENNILDNIDLGNTTIYEPEQTWEENTTYYVTIHSYNNFGVSNNCLASKFTTIFKIPKFFTPNNDGKHDTWKVINNTNTIKSIQIYDRYGKLLQVLKNQNILSWNGEYNSKPIQGTDYWYILSFNTSKQIIGHFSLIRNNN